MGAEQFCSHILLNINQKKIIVKNILLIILMAFSFAFIGQSQSVKITGYSCDYEGNPDCSGCGLNTTFNGLVVQRSSAIDQALYFPIRVSKVGRLITLVDPFGEETVFSISDTKWSSLSEFYNYVESFSCTEGGGAGGGSGTTIDTTTFLRTTGNQELNGSLKAGDVAGGVYTLLDDSGLQVVNQNFPGQSLTLDPAAGLNFSTSNSLVTVGDGSLVVRDQIIGNGNSNIGLGRIQILERPPGYTSNNFDLLTKPEIESLISSNSGPSIDTTTFVRTSGDQTIFGNKGFVGLTTLRNISANTGSAGYMEFGDLSNVNGGRVFKIYPDSLIMDNSLEIRTPSNNVYVGSGFWDDGINIKNNTNDNVLYLGNDNIYIDKPSNNTSLSIQSDRLNIFNANTNAFNNVFDNRIQIGRGGYTPMNQNDLLRKVEIEAMISDSIATVSGGGGGSTDLSGVVPYIKSVKDTIQRTNGTLIYDPTRPYQMLLNPNEGLFVQSTSTSDNTTVTPGIVENATSANGSSIISGGQIRILNRAGVAVQSQDLLRKDEIDASIANAVGNKLNKVGVADTLSRNNSFGIDTEDITSIGDLGNDAQGGFFAVTDSNFIYSGLKAANKFSYDYNDGKAKLFSGTGITTVSTKIYRDSLIISQDNNESLGKATVGRGLAKLIRQSGFTSTDVDVLTKSEIQQLVSDSLTASPSSVEYNLEPYIVGPDTVGFILTDDIVGTATHDTVRFVATSGGGGGEGGGAQRYFNTLTTNTSRTSYSTYADWTKSVVAGEVWHVQVYAIVTGSPNSAFGYSVRARMNGGTATFNGVGRGAEAGEYGTAVRTSPVYQIGPQFNSGSFNGIITNVVNNGTDRHILTVDAILTVTADGVFEMTWAGESGNTNTTMNTGSTFLMTKLN